MSNSISGRTFTNPLVTSETIGDPFVVFHNGAYYLTGTFDARSLRVWKSPTLTGLDQGEKRTVWTAPESGPQSRQVWAPELFRFDGRWYLYYTASDGVDSNHRHRVLESAGDDPLGPYEERGLVHPEWDSYAIDGSVLALPDGRLYWMYAASGLWIAPMESPTRAVGPSVRFVEGTHEWERSWVSDGNGGWRRSSDSYWIEAPQMLLRNDRVFVAYSAGHTAVRDYFLGLLEWTGGDPLDPVSWVKWADPLFGPRDAEDGQPDVHSTGHNSFTRSPDGTEDWLIYHATDGPNGRYTGRTVRTQPFTWHADGTPNLGRPIPSGIPLPAPSGEPVE